MGQVKQSIIDLPDDDFQQLLTDDREYQNWLDNVESESEHIRRTEKAVPEGSDTLQDRSDEQAF